MACFRPNSISKRRYPRKGLTILSTFGGIAFIVRIGILLQILERHSYDLTTVLQVKLDAGYNTHFPDDSHWNTTGHEVAAGAIAGFMSTRGP